MSRHTHEFQCTNCMWWNYPILSETMDGNYVVKCGHCKHLHYRTIKQGVVTEIRHNQYKDNLDVIHVMPSACLEKKRIVGTVTSIRENATSGLMT